MPPSPTHSSRCSKFKTFMHSWFIKCLHSLNFRTGRSSDRYSGTAFPFGSLLRLAYAPSIRPRRSELHGAQDINSMKRSIIWKASGRACAPWLGLWVIKSSEEEEEDHKAVIRSTLWWRWKDEVALSAPGLTQRQFERCILAPWDFRHPDAHS